MGFHMFDVGFQEMLLIMVLALIVFGPSKLPELGKMIGRAMREFRRASDEFRSTVETNLNIHDLDLPSASSPAPAGLFPTIAPSGSSAPAESAPAIPAAPGDAEPSPEAGGVATEQEATGARYWAQRGSRLFHSRDCGWATRIASAERIPFETVARAREEGHVACPVCEPVEVGLAL
ncbi:MAG: twin-arginine translocase subunit TatB [Candidatus Rokuibacteriota bacterium]|nr:MAG: twin-arginine translocase subunit TatB [Candidatus Rokubacteria bacterium]